MAEANIPKPTYPVSMRKSGFSPEEIKDIIHSKAQAIFGNDVDTTEVFKQLKIRVTKDGNLDRRQICTGLIQESGAVPASPDGKTLKGPKALAQQCLQDWAKEYKKYQQKLFDLLLCNHMLDNDIYSCVEGTIHENNKECSSVEFCNFLDSLANVFKDREPSMRERADMQKVRKLCLSITYLRICTAAAFPDDILEANGYKKWRKHLWMIASFAALMVGLDIYLNKEIDRNEPVGSLGTEQY